MRETNPWRSICRAPPEQTGSRSPQGYHPGPKGDTGAQGAAVPQGPQGGQSVAGVQGPVGAQGVPGDKGNRGEKGDKGDLGGLLRVVQSDTLPLACDTGETLVSIMCPSGGAPDGLKCMTVPSVGFCMKK